MAATSGTTDREAYSPLFARIVVSCLAKRAHIGVSRGNAH